MSLHHNKAIKIFCEIAYIGPVGYISSLFIAIGIRHLSGEPQIPSSNLRETFVEIF